MKRTLSLGFYQRYLGSDGIGWWNSDKTREVLCFFGCGQRLLNPGWLMISHGILTTGNLSLGDCHYHLHLRHIVGIRWNPAPTRAFFLKRRKEVFFSSSVGSTAHVLIGAILNGFVGSMRVLKTCRGAMRRTENRGSMWKNIFNSRGGYILDI